VRADLESWAQEAADVHELELYDVEIVTHGKLKIDVMVDKPGPTMKGEGVTIAECAQVSRYIEALIDADERIDERYALDVGSPGIERQLKRPRHFAGAVGETVSVLLRQAIESEYRFAGTVVSFDEEAGSFELEVGHEGDEPVVHTIVLEHVKKAHVTYDFDADPDE